MRQNWQGTPSIYSRGADSAPAAAKSTSGGGSNICQECPFVVHDRVRAAQTSEQHSGHCWDP
jgi:hypothetical protein